MSIAVSLHSQEYSRAENIQCSSIPDNVFYSLVLAGCYTEVGVKYNLDTIGLANLNADEKEKNKVQDSMEECRTYCRHLNSFTFHGLQEGSLIIFVFVVTHMKRQSTSLGILAPADVCVRKITMWMRPGHIH